MKDNITSKLREGRFSTPSEYIRSLIRDDQNLETVRPGPPVVTRRGAGERPQLKIDD